MFRRLEPKKWAIALDRWAGSHSSYWGVAGALILFFSWTLTTTIADRANSLKVALERVRAQRSELEWRMTLLERLESMFESQGIVHQSMGESQTLSLQTAGPSAVVSSTKSDEKARELERELTSLFSELTLSRTWELKDYRWAVSELVDMAHNARLPLNLAIRVEEKLVTIESVADDLAKARRAVFKVAFPEVEVVPNAKPDVDAGEMYESKRKVFSPSEMTTQELLEMREKLRIPAATYFQLSKQLDLLVKNASSDYQKMIKYVDDAVRSSQRLAAAAAAISTLLYACGSLMILYGKSFELRRKRITPTASE